MRIGAVVEGLGERKALPSLVAKLAIVFNTQAFVVHVVECGNWGSLRKAGGLERFGRLLLADCECDKIIYAVDLDDGCPKEEFEKIQQRLENMSQEVSKPIAVMLMNREYETWFLQNITGIKSKSPEIEWRDVPEPNDPLAIRDAKGAFEKHLPMSYRPSIDQDKFTKKLDIEFLLGASRSLRKLAALILNCSNEVVVKKLEAL